MPSKRNINKWKIKQFEWKKKYITETNNNNNIEKEDIIIEKAQIEKDEDDIRLALERIQKTINDLDEEKKEIYREKLNIMKIYQDLKNNEYKLNNQKLKMDIQRGKIQKGFNTMDNLQYNYKLNRSNLKIFIWIMIIIMKFVLMDYTIIIKKC